MQLPVTVLNANTKREQGKKAQLGNIVAAKAVADIIRTTLGPRSMLKMLLDPNGGIVLTNDGHAILREIDVTHPAAKSMIQLSRTQDEEVGDGTTSVIILAGELLHVAEPLLEKNLHPTVINKGYAKALEDALKIIQSMSFPIDINNRSEMLNVVNSCIATKFTHRFGTLMAELALDAVQCVAQDLGNGQREIDIKNYAKVEKIPGGTIEECKVLKGVMFNKDVVAPGRMRRKIHNPRILLLDCPLEYKKGENQTNVEITKEEDWAALLKAEEDAIQKMCEQIASFKPDLVVTEKGLSDLAAHFLTKAGISAIRRLRKTDNNRIARACGATIVHRTEEIRESDIGTGAGLFEVVKIGDEFFSFVVDCKAPKACSIVLRGASKDILNEVERNLVDAMGVARNICVDPRLVPGGGACELAISQGLANNAAGVEGTEAWAYRAVGTAVEVIPRTLAQNCGANVIRTLTKLRAKHADEPGCSYGINGDTGEVTDMKALGIWEPVAVKQQTIKTAVESAQMLLRIDDIVSGISRKDKSGPSRPAGGAEVEGDGDNVDAERQLPE
uniref:T-complex protein 1 subunit gamma n=1 Tax=Chlamydomonas leiostraca TaxID=1034604 RepID=A0A7S0S179_9CHLO|mmetsp:Transcript_38019/g.96160  ORF Transcript_38019/g.96160 Transcript_38019/m.96160 type:complete len:559 (+) Transcript_38019:94-1770(+)|eukprot:CAMPEP_0202866884 /NCGR_PEP_ID=MMETSP1391-20130828/8408_1 /ASSEMBLY_ACC=CAM_ASM_000867 /TAXON_ID=1034604 /ORGANISM="Chlamydomonas leiostraca, Strain SAG 11-49" /LENGTH=558 /DNA_ID=CAMNT_0049546871 /DNA_START=89 /DNA_END=1765 /DNA_ORIENTATION=-